MPDARPLPTGTVTFLFTDIEGSTRLAEALADGWPALLERHRRIIRDALAAHGGIEVLTEGDGFFAVFTSAPEAVAASVEAQRALAAEPWPQGASIRVRMGLHSGNGSVDSEGLYVGHDVHRAARVGSAGHGGQIVISESTQGLVADALPTGASLKDLGPQRLKDLRPQPLAQVVVDGLAADFPALRSVDSRPNNLPVQVTSFVGREQELRTAVELLERTRLLTLTGPGGTGKTRLALQLAADVAEAFPDGLWFVALEPLRDPQLVMSTIAHVLGASPRPDRPAIDAVAAALGDRKVLLVLDNFEQVVDAAGDVAALLRACSGLKVVVTSRAVLHVAGEQEFVVPGLPAPPDTSHLSRVELENLPADVRRPDPATLDQYEAVRLFIVRARSTVADFAVTTENAMAVAGITARLRGMPLAIELAAARVKLLTPEQIFARLEQQLGILTSSARDLPDRQRTLRGAIAWSYELLDEAHRQLLARLSVFRGGWDLESAEALLAQCPAVGIDALDGLSDLIDQSLVRRVDDGDDGVRFSMLDSIREFALEMLAESGEREAVRDAHARVYLGLAEEAAPALHGAEQRRWLDRLERDHDNLRAAMAWCLERPDPRTAVGLTFALWRFWQQRGYLDEARRLSDRIVEQGWQLDEADRARFAEAAGGFAYWQGDTQTAARWYDEALEIRRSQDDGTREARLELAKALYNRGYTTVAEIMHESVDAAPDPAAQPLLEEALAIYRDLGDAAGEGNLLWALASYAMFSSEQASAREHFAQAIALHRQTGQRTMEAWSLHMLSVSELLDGRVAEATDASSHALRHFDAAGDIAGITLALDVHSAVALARGERERGGRLWGAARQLQQVSGTGIADWDKRLLARLPVSVETVFSEDELAGLSAQGARLSLREAVAYASRTEDPFEEAEGGAATAGATPSGGGAGRARP